MTVDGQPFSALPSIPFMDPAKEVPKLRRHHHPDVKAV
jgi:hypothetical protein